MASAQSAWNYNPRLFTAGSNDGNGDSPILDNDDPEGKRRYPIRTWTMTGTFDGASIQLYGSPPRASSSEAEQWVALGAAVTAAGTTNITGNWTRFKATLSSHGSNTKVDAWLF